jgi:hypothetical protein
VAPASFATLLNNKICVPSTLKTHYSVEKFFLSECLKEYISSVYLDEEWYLATYPDVATALANNPSMDARSHYVRFGYFEDRRPYAIKVDDAWYRENYKDVEQAVAEKNFASAQEHFDRIGYREGRLPFPGFSLRTAQSV